MGRRVIARSDEAEPVAHRQLEIGGMRQPARVSRHVRSLAVEVHSSILLARVPKGVEGLRCERHWRKRERHLSSRKRCIERWL